MNIDGTTLILYFLAPPLVAGPQQYKHKIGYKYFTFQHPKKLGTFFYDLKVIFAKVVWELDFDNFLNFEIVRSDLFCSIPTVF